MNFLPRNGQHSFALFSASNFSIRRIIFLTKTANESNMWSCFIPRQRILTRILTGVKWSDRWSEKGLNQAAVLIVLIALGL